MHLSQIRLIGFKSFPQETSISFQPGIIAIVGPNGCGKSNLCDAIRWVLGEQGHRPLRAGRMEDIIFNGNGTHPALGMAEVSLTISAHEDQLPIDFSEITITRRFFRSGEGEYLLNGSPCLLRDIQGLFLDSGLGNVPYALIEQGALTLVIESKPEERRVMIDEAAGIMKYKVRRKAALSKLEAAEGNLLRLEDIITEVEQQRNALHRQAKRAKEYGTLRTRIEYLEGYLRLTELKRIEGELNGLALRLNEANDERLSLSAEIHRREGVLESDRLHLLTLDGGLQEAQNSLYQIRKELEKISVQLEMLLQEGKDLGEATMKTKGEILSAASRIDQLEKELNEEKIEKESQGDNLGILSRSMEGLREKEGELGQELSGLMGRLEEKRREAIHAAALSTTTRNQLISMENQNRRLIQQRERLQAQHEAITTEQRENQEKDTGMQERSLSLNLSHEAWEIRRHQVLAAFSSAQEERRDIGLKLEALQREASEISTRLRSYEDIQRSYLGYGEGAQFILQNREAMSSPDIGLLGTLADLFDTIPGYEKAIEALLDSELQGLVINEMNGIRRALRELEPLQKGGVVFLPLGPASPLGNRGEGKEGPDLLSPHIIGPAIELIKYEPRYEGIMRRLFAQSWVVEDLETAIRIFEEGWGGFSIATLKGEAITPKGSIRLPSTSSLGILVRKREAKVLAHQWEEISRELEQVQSRREESEHHIQRLQGESEGLQKEGQDLQIERITLEKDLGQLSAERERLSRQRETIALEMGTMEEEETELKKVMLATQQEEKETASRQLDCEEEVRKLQASAEGLRGRQHQVLMERDRCEKELQKQRDSMRENEVRRVRKEEQLHSFRGRKEDLDRELEEVRARSLKIETSIGERQGALSDLGRQESEADAALAEMKSRREGASRLLAQQEEGIALLKRKLSGIDGASADLQIKKAQIEQTLFHLRQDLPSAGLPDSSQARAQYEEEAMEASQTQEELARIKERCLRLEPVNMAALMDFEALSKRCLFLNSQAEDLRGSVASLRQTISEINKTTRTLFKEAFTAIRQNFEEYCGHLFGGGSAEMRLQEGKGEEEPGVEIMVSPPGKHLAHLDLLSGGEKALASFAFLMALFKYRPTPFCLLDEVDAPLDDANIGRYLSLLKEYSKEHQFILVTHNKKSMEAADILYGVTMEQPGISKVVSAKFNGGPPRKGPGVETNPDKGGRDGD